jgi:hypothetical protein
MIRTLKTKQSRKENHQTILSNQARQNQMQMKASIFQNSNGGPFTFVKNKGGLLRAQQMAMHWVKQLSMLLM